jgi:hypothetical protein
MMKMGIQGQKCRFKTQERKEEMKNKAVRISTYRVCILVFSERYFAFFVVRAPTVMLCFVLFLYFIF